MGERKVVNKYYPPDFDPLKLRKPKMPADKQVKTRMMLPFTCKCNICGTYLHIGTKFNMRKETLPDESYLGIEVIRFYFKCTRCTTEITMKTDPRNHDYVCESNATRQYDERRDLEAAEEALEKMKKEEEQDPMKFLEARTYESRREMDIMNALSEIIELNKLQAKPDTDKLLSDLRQKRQEQVDFQKSQINEEDIKLARVKRIDETEFNKHLEEKRLEAKGLTKRVRDSGSRLKPKFIVKKQVSE